MPTNRKNGPKTPEEQREDFELKERAKERGRQDLRDFNNEGIADGMADYNGEDAPAQTANGRRITRQGKTKRSSAKNLRDSFIADGMVNSTSVIAESLILLATAGLMFQSEKPGMAGTFERNSTKQRMGTQPPHEDANYIYDTMNVSKPVHDKLLREAEVIAKKIEELHAVKSPAKRAQLTENIEKLAEEFEMRIHPLTGVYIHDFYRVMKEEKTHSAKGMNPSLDREFNVCVFLAKSELSDLRGIKAKIADQYDQTPEEIQVSGDHLKGQAPTPRP